MIYADENVWYPVVEGLRRRGWNVTTAREEGTLGDPDEDQLEYAAANGWGVLTFDDDFLSLVERELEHVDRAGIVYASQYGRDVGGLVREIDRVLQRTDDRERSNQILFA